MITNDKTLNNEINNGLSSIPSLIVVFELYSLGMLGLRDYTPKINANILIELC